MSSFSHLLTLLKEVVKMMEVRGYDTDHFALLSQYTSALFESTMPGYFKALVKDYDVRTEPKNVWEQLKQLDHTTFRCMMSYIFTHRVNKADRFLVYFAEVGTTKQVPVTEAQTFGSLLEKQKCLSGCIVTHNKMSSQAMTRISELEAPGIYFLQHFNDEDLLYNPLDSVWGSETTILSPDEAKALLAKVHPTQMPKITLDEPVAKYLGIRPGQVVMEVRENVLPEMLCDTEIFYRYAGRRPPEKKKSVKAPAKVAPVAHI